MIGSYNLKTTDWFQFNGKTYIEAMEIRLEVQPLVLEGLKFGFAGVARPSLHNFSTNTVSNIMIIRWDNLVIRFGFMYDVVLRSIKKGDERGLEKATGIEVVGRKFEERWAEFEVLRIIRWLCWFFYGGARHGCRLVWSLDCVLRQFLFVSDPAG